MVSASKTSKHTISVCLSPLQYSVYHKPGNLVVLIDVIRATTVICTALNYGAESILPLSDIQTTLDLKQKGYLVAGERDSQKLSGFDCGNSPLEFASQKIEGKCIAITTTNGTQALSHIPPGTEIVAGSWVNFDILVDYLIASENNILLLCAGWKNAISIEDTLFAGQVAKKLLDSEKFTYETDAVSLALLTAQNAGNSELEFILKHSPRLRQKFETLQKDVEFCLLKNSQPVVPFMFDRTFKKAKIKR
ncbi:MAG TPA: 2-phosphosulfolactate phosphatase [Salinivirgaceae bacterium]|nr:2-phosphosulfolactate phosphatase [Salinivirgaceae bacterium]